MQTFHGRRTGEKILDEQVKRGDGEDIHAVILFCDLRKLRRRQFVENRAEEVVVVSRRREAVDVN